MSARIRYPEVERIPPQVAAVAVAVLAGARSVTDVAEACGWASTSTAYRWLVYARQVGLVHWWPRRSGTLRSTVGVVVVA